MRILLTIFGMVLSTSVVWARCETQPPPDGLVKRCHAHTITVPETYRDFETEIREWIATCVEHERAPDLVDDNASLAEVWNWIAEHRGRRFRILPDYTPNSWTDDYGRTCYGVADVDFYLDRPSGEVEMGGDDDMELEYGADDDQIEQAARRALEALDSHSGDGIAASRLHCVLELMEREGDDFDDVYYPVAPGLDLTGSLNPPTCYKEGRYGVNGYDYHCLSGPEALASCKRRLTDALVVRVAGGPSDEDLVGWLLRKDDDINRGVVHLTMLKNSGSKAMVCQGVPDLMSDIAHRPHANAIYACY